MSSSSRSSARRPEPPGNGRRERGQAAVELALVLPLVAVVALAVVQVGVVARDQLLVVHAAREAARHLAVDPDPARARAAAARASALKVDRLTVETSHQGGSVSMVTAEVAYRSPTEVPLVGPLLPDLTLRAKAAMRDEVRHIVAGPTGSVKNLQEPRHDLPNRASVPQTGPARST